MHAFPVVVIQSSGTNLDPVTTGEFTNSGSPRYLESKQNGSCKANVVDSRTFFFKDATGQVVDPDSRDGSRCCSPIILH